MATNQPRVPKGSSDGGQWTGSGGALSANPKMALKQDSLLSMQRSRDKIFPLAKNVPFFTSKPISQMSNKEKATARKTPFVGKPFQLKAKK